MHGERWTSKWQPTADNRGGSRTASSDERRQDGRNLTQQQHVRPQGPGQQQSAADLASRWERRGDHLPSPSNACTSRQFHGERRGQPHAPQNHPDRQGQGGLKWNPSGGGLEWSHRGGHDSGQSLEAEFGGEMYGGLDPGEAPGVHSGPHFSCQDAWPRGGDAGRAIRDGADRAGSDFGEGFDGAYLRPPDQRLLLQLEEAVSRREHGDWSLAKLADAATALCEQLIVDPPGQDPSSINCPLSPREHAVMDALATAAVHRLCGNNPCPPCGGPVPMTTATTPAQRAWAASQFLWCCARGQYWAGPPPPNCSAPVRAPSAGPRGEGTARGSEQERGRSASAAQVRLDGEGAGDGASASDATTEPLDPKKDHTRCWVCTASATSTITATDPTTASAAAGPDLSNLQLSTSSTTTSTSSSTSPAWRPLAVAALDLLGVEGCLLASHLDCRSVALVWWALAKASAAGRHRPGATPGAAGIAAAARAVLAAATPDVVAALEARAVETLRSASTSQVCSLLYAVAAVNRGSQRLAEALGEELTRRLEAALYLPAGSSPGPGATAGPASLAGGGGGFSGGSGGGAEAGGAGRCFSSRELSCVAYAYGLMGVRLEPLMEAMTEYVVSNEQLKWSPSALSIFMYGLANTGHRDPRLMAWADAAIASKPAASFNPRNISFLLYHFHRLRWWPRRAGQHLLAASRLHVPRSIPVISISTVLMCLGSARVRDAAALAHLCSALCCWPAEGLMAKDVCICLTALQRLHGEDVLASQQPEVLAALRHLTSAITLRGFSRPAPGPGGAGRAVPLFNSQEVSNIMFALGKIKYYSPAVLRALRRHAALGGLEGASAWDCTAILVGLAQLNYHEGEEGEGDDREEGGRAGGSGGGGGGLPDVDLIGTLVDVVARRARTVKNQDLANTLWALSVLDGALQRYRSAVTVMVEESNRRAGSRLEGFSLDEQRQFWQVHRELAALPQPYTSLVPELVLQSRLGMAEADHTYSRVQATFQSVLEAMHRDGRFRGQLEDLLWEQELVPGGEQLMRIDVQAMIARPGPDGTTTVSRVAVEFDGPFHFMVNEPYTTRIDGRTALRNRILARHLGPENVVCVSMAEWVAASREPVVRGMPGRWRLLANKMGLRC